MLQLSFVNFRQNSYLFVEGKENNDHFYIIQSGNVRCFKQNDVKGLSVKNLGPGDFVGVIPCMSGHSQIESAISVTDVKCISVRKDQYSELIEKNTPIALKIIRTFANRMRTMNEQLTNFSNKSVTVETSEHIYEVAKYYEKIRAYDIAIFAYYQYMKENRNGAHISEAQGAFRLLSTKSRLHTFEPPAEGVRVYEKDRMIFSESQSGADMFVIQSGQVRISKVINGNEVVLAVLKPGDMFGEMALLENKLRSASAIAHETCKLIVLNKDNFDMMVSTQPQLISRLTTTLAERLWTSYRQLDNACLVNPIHKMIDMLALQAEKARKSSGVFEPDITSDDLANMCSIPLEQHNKANFQLRQERCVRFVDNKIVVPDCAELLKVAAFYRKIEDKQLSGKAK